MNIELEEYLKNEQFKIIPAVLAGPGVAAGKRVGAIREFVVRHGIACGLRVDGTLYIATNRAQKGVMDPVMDVLSGAGLSRWERIGLLAARRFAGTEDLDEGFYSAHAGSVQPAMMVRDAIRRKEAAEDAGKAPLWTDTWLSGFARSAGKADK